MAFVVRIVVGLMILCLANPSFAPTVGRRSTDQFQFVEQNSVECWCDFGANLVQHFMRRYSRYSRYRTKSHDKATISNVFPRYSRYQTVLLKLQEIITAQRRLFQNTKSSASVGLFVFWSTSIIAILKSPLILRSHLQRIQSQDG